MQAVLLPSCRQETGLGPQLSFIPTPGLPLCCVSFGKSRYSLSLSFLVWKRGVITHLAGL